MQIFNWDKTGFEQTYIKSYYRQLGCGAVKARSCRCSEYEISYSRKFFENDSLFIERANNIVTRFGLSEGTDIFVVGCGLGFLMEELKNLNMNVWGCDNSFYVHTIKNKEKAKFTIHNISVTDPDFVNKIRNATGAMWFDLIITEDVLPSHDSYSDILTNCEGLLNSSKSKSNIVHIVNPDVDYPFAKKTLLEWGSLNPEHTWLNMVGVSG